jgi:predicted SAM-dependent methyltransferase
MRTIKKFADKIKNRLFSDLISFPYIDNKLKSLLLYRIKSSNSLPELPPLIESIIQIIVHEYGDKVLNELSDCQRLSVLDHLIRTKHKDVICIVTAHLGGSFKYIGDGDIRVIIGAGPHKIKGWLATDIDELNIIMDSSWARLFNVGSISRLLGEHVFEHLTLDEFHDALKNVYKYLKPGGFLRLAVPDAFHPSRYYYNLVKPGGLETPYEHKLFFDYEMLSRIANDIGFEVRLLEYFDEKGFFHESEYNIDDGIILRCRKNNIGLDVNNPDVMLQFYASIPQTLRQQFIDYQITYTSLIADLIKSE